VVLLILLPAITVLPDVVVTTVVPVGSPAPPTDSDAAQYSAQARVSPSSMCAGLMAASWVKAPTGSMKASVPVNKIDVHGSVTLRGRPEMMSSHSCWQNSRFRVSFSAGDSGSIWMPWMYFSSDPNHVV